MKGKLLGIGALAAATLVSFSLKFEEVPKALNLGHKVATTPATVDDTFGFKTRVIDVEVERIVDGDSLYLLDRDETGLGKFEARIACIDAFEATQKGGELSEDALVKALSGPGDLLAVVHEQDRYGRYITSLRKGGEDIGHKLVISGYALPYMTLAPYQPPNKEYMSNCNRNKYHEAFKYAFGNDLGVFGLPEDERPQVAPWTYRN